LVGHRCDSFTPIGSRSRLAAVVRRRQRTSLTITCHPGPGSACHAVLPTSGGRGREDDGWHPDHLTFSLQIEAPRNGIKHRYRVGEHHVIWAVKR
jgi:hypothetical protein